MWRRLLVPDHIPLELFHMTVQDSFGWLNCHLHEFEPQGGPLKGARIGMTDPEVDPPPELLDETKFLLGALGLAEGDRVRYWYDFGDDWVHEILVEKLLAPAGLKGLPVCTDGARACPPEDCGGPGGYADLLEALADPKTEEQKEIVEWVGGNFDPEDFNVSRTNKMLTQCRRATASP